MSGLGKVWQVLLTALFALMISVLTFAASNAEVPKSTFLPVEVTSD